MDDSSPTAGNAYSDDTGQPPDGIGDIVGDIVGDAQHSLNLSDLSEQLLDAYYAERFGPRRDPLYVVIPITLIYAAIFVTGCIGNTCTCLVIARNRSMHTATNYYLFSLAVSDFVLLVAGVPLEIYSIWSRYPYVFGERICQLRGMAAEAAANATVLTISAFTVERYVAICHPFLSHTMSKLSRAVRLIVCMWSLAIVSAVPQALQFHVITVDGLAMCAPTEQIVPYSFELSTLVFFAIPMAAITVLYVLIGLKLRTASRMPRASALAGRQTGPSSRRVLKMLVAVVVAFFLCWAPFHIQRLIAIHGDPTQHLQLYVVATYVSGILYYLSTCVNPILYNLMSNKFREAFKVDKQRIGTTTTLLAVVVIIPVAEPPVST